MKISFISRADGMDRIKIPRTQVVANKLPKKALYRVVIEMIEEEQKA